MITMKKSKTVIFFKCCFVMSYKYVKNIFKNTSVCYNYNEYLTLNV